MNRLILLLLGFPYVIWGQTYNEYRAFLIQFEGYKQQVYVDKYANLSVGIGHNISVDNRFRNVQVNQWITKKKVEQLFKEDLERALNTANFYIKDFNNLDKGVKLVTVSIIFNVGHTGFSRFKYYIMALNGENPGNFTKKPNYLLASIELSGSLWANQVSKERLDNHLQLLKEANNYAKIQ